MLFGTQKVASDGHLHVGGCDSVDLARRFGTPLYVVDEEFLRARMREYISAFSSRYPEVLVAYAGKAFLTTAMARIVEQEGLYLDVASAGELFTALQADFPANRLVVHGNNKSRSEIRMAIECGAGRIVVDSVYELDLIAEVADQLGANPSLLIRSNPGVDPHTHRLIRTGQEDSKFGLNIKDGSALAVIWKCNAHPHLQFAGIHCHVGSQLLDAEAHVEAADVMCAFMREIQDATGLSVQEINLGGGLGIRYLEEQQPVDVDSYAAAIVGAVLSGLQKYGLKTPVLAVEPGRSIAGQAGITLYEVGAIKQVPIPEEPGVRTYVSVDGGLSDNPRPQMYDAVYEAFVAGKADLPRDMRVRIAGKHCETDILIQDAFIQQVEPGDILAVQGTGAYNYAMASNYNRLPRPAVVLVREGQADIIVTRESLEDLVRHDVIPERLELTEGAKI